MAENAPTPPVPKYELTIVVTGNSHDELMNELVVMTRGGYLIRSDYYKRDSFDAYGGRGHMTLVHKNPDMTPEQYEADLAEWFQAQKTFRQKKREADGA